MRALVTIAAAALLVSACRTTHVHQYPTPLPPPPVPADPAPVYQPAPPSHAQVNVEFHYFDSHIVPVDFGGGWCNHSGLHTHHYHPHYVDMYVYRNHVWYFGADISWTYENDYYGHPVPPEFGGGWCDARGRHNHGWRPHDDYDYDDTRRVFVYRPSPSRPTNRPTPTRPQPQPIPYGNDNRPQEYPRPVPVQEYPAPSNRPVPVDTTPNRPTPIPYGNDNRPQEYPRPVPVAEQPAPTQPNRPVPVQERPAPTPTQPAPSRPTPIPYGDDVRPQEYPRPTPAQPPPPQVEIIRPKPLPPVRVPVDIGEVPDRPNPAPVTPRPVDPTPVQTAPARPDGRPGDAVTPRPTYVPPQGTTRPRPTDEDDDGGRVHIPRIDPGPRNPAIVKPVPDIDDRPSAVRVNQPTRVIQAPRKVTPAPTNVRTVQSDDDGDSSEQPVQKKTIKKLAPLHR